MKKKKTSEIIMGVTATVIPVLCIIVIWIAAAKSVDNEYLLPTFGDTFKRFGELFTYPEFYRALGGTLLRSLIAFAVSFSLAFLFAFLSTKYKFAKNAIAPVIAITRALPTIAIVLLLIVWTNSLVAPVIVTMLVVLPTLYTNLTESFSAVDKDVLEACKLYKVPQSAILKKVQIPQMLPSLLQAAGAGLSLNLKLMVAAEVISQTPYSMGYLLNYSKVNYAISTMLALVIVSVIIGIVIELLFNLLSKKAGKWQ